MDNYIERDGVPVVVSDINEWARWHKNQDNRRVALDTLAGGVQVSTVFLGIDHSFGGDTPILYETMVFGGVLSDECERYATRKEAEAGHAAMIKRVKSAELKAISLARFTRNHAAALLHRVRTQRDAERKSAEKFDALRWKAEERTERERASATQTMRDYREIRAELAQADAARVVALQVAEAAQKRAEAAQAQAEELRELVEAFVHADTVSYNYGKMQQVVAKARRLLAAHKAQERA